MTLRSMSAFGVAPLYAFKHGASLISMATLAADAPAGDILKQP